MTSNKPFPSTTTPQDTDALPQEVLAPHDFWPADFWDVVPETDQQRASSAKRPNI